MRRPARVSLALHKGQLPEAESDVLVVGESHEVYTMLSGLADIAWDMGWRPSGLPGQVAQFIQNYKPVKEA